MMNFGDQDGVPTGRLDFTGAKTKVQWRKSSMVIVSTLNLFMRQTSSPLTLLILLLTCVFSPVQSEDVLCPPLESGGYWSGLASPDPTTPLSQGEWVTPGCKLRTWSRGDFRNRRIAIIGDSVSRFVMFDLAAEMFRCPALVDCNPRVCNSGIPDSISKDVGSLREPCASLYQYTYVKRLHENLYLRDPVLNASLDLYWISYAEEFLRHGWVKPLFVNPAYDAFIVSLGLWDVGVKPKPGLDVTPSVAHHCAWIVSHVKDLFLNTLFLANPSLKRNFLFWTTTYSEPYRNPNAPTTEYERFPHDQLDTVNRCSRMAFKDALGTPFFNTSSLLRSPPRVLSRLVAAEKSNDTDGARLLTLDGYHPHRITRAALISEIMNHYVSMWGPPAPWNEKEEERVREGSSRVVLGGEGGDSSAPLSSRGGGPLGDVVTNPPTRPGGDSGSNVGDELSWVFILGVAVIVFIGGLTVIKFGDGGEKVGGGGGKFFSSTHTYSGLTPPSTNFSKGKKVPPSWARRK